MVIRTFTTGHTTDAKKIDVFVEREHKLELLMMCVVRKAWRNGWSGVINALSAHFSHRSVDGHYTRLLSGDEQERRD